MNRISIQHLPLQLTIQTQKTKIGSVQSKQSFFDHLQEVTSNQPLKISKHANDRIMERNISISEQEWQRVSEKVVEARSKGVNQPLVLMDQAALIVSAKNETVITAMERSETKNQLFTNIDGTIVL
ncbi:TIGR02530 family flagellar biosynthesis protein [Ureibacillus sinduriensis]|uniref:Flagellar protein n=1 Tax=Ureibacillus sinduriensis BLB-1 = JCM 15800 TaxID=1384057 RepID=A0A0A3IGC9_9BACL|nr:TIGR02530 family flagellar biosynthesis protein [Ureibacillus sinduriensis]KGR73897.1 flagellar protein [Ureibacillus sinduriensis BLB-1 = JCM 15800]